MVTNTSTTNRAVLSPMTKDRVQLGPFPDWVEACAFQADFKGDGAGHVSHLLVDRQINAELGQTFFHVAMRLDSMQAVQKESPWRLDFEPRHQQITLHAIKTWRGGAEFDHANLASVRVVDRHAPGMAPQDRLTLLLMLEDVRPGDILEWSYTVESRAQLLPEHCAAMFVLPPGAPVGRFYFSLLFDGSRTMRWKSSVLDWQPVEKRNQGDVQWVWTQENYPGLRPEENTPDWHVEYPWIQVSDCPDWGTVATAFAKAWQAGEKDAAAGNVGTAGAGDIDHQAERAIQTVQDEYRYLAADWELDGQPPVPPEIVARRRYGDGKDLSFLLLHLLKKIGVPARLVLVNTTFRKSLAELLPAPGVFDHLLVECEIRGQTRWVDATFKRQDGVARDFGAGLPIAGHAAGLIELRDGWARNGVCELTESFLLDTTGGWSTLGVVLAASGGHAAALREELEREGLEGLAKKRLRQCAERFKTARRAGPLEYRDDRDANEFFLAEVFEIKGFLTPDQSGKWHKLDLPNDYIANFLKTPDGGARTRRTPFALPHPCHIAHTIELHSVSLAPTAIQQRGVGTKNLRFARLRKTMAGIWTMRLTLSTLADAVPPESLEQHSEALQELREQSEWSILVPAGEARPRQRADFGKLPAAWDPASLVPASFRQTIATPGNQAQKTSVAPAAPEPAVENETSNGKQRRRKSRKRDPNAKARRPIALACVSALVLIVIVILVAKYADRLSLFQTKMAPPPSPINFVR